MSQEGEGSASVPTAEYAASIHPSSETAPPAPSLDEIATVGHFEDIRQWTERELRNVEFRLKDEIEAVLFARMHEFMAGRYETRISELQSAVEALNREVSQLRAIWPRDASTRSRDTTPGRPNPVVEVGSATAARESTSAIQGDSGSREPGDSVAQPVPVHTSALEGVVTQLSETVRKMSERLVTERRASPDVDVDEPTDGFTNYPAGTHHDGGPERVDREIREGHRGPAYPGLEPLTTLQAPFERAVSYRTYRFKSH